MKRDIAYGNHQPIEHIDLTIYVKQHNSPVQTVIMDTLGYQENSGGNFQIYNYDSCGCYYNNNVRESHKKIKV